jgi:large conductance mechanosensitive channel
MGFFSEFKSFAFKGNVMDLAVGVVIGNAFSTIVKSLVDDVITPLILTPALKLARLENIKDLKWGTVTYGSFLSNVITFFIVAMVLFLLIRVINRHKRKEEENPSVPPVPSKEEKLLTEIRDILASQKNTPV